MKFTYSENPDFRFPYWLVYETTPTADLNFTTIMDINEWCGEQFGELGKKWGYTKETDSSGATPGMNTVRIRLFATKVLYCWRFENKEDAALFKMIWHK